MELVLSAGHGRVGRRAEGSRSDAFILFRVAGVEARVCWLLALAANKWFSQFDHFRTASLGDNDASSPNAAHLKAMAIVLEDASCAQGSQPANDCHAAGNDDALLPVGLQKYSSSSCRNMQTARSTIPRIRS